MSYLSNKLLIGLSSFRSTVFFCLILMATSIASRLKSLMPESELLTDPCRMGKLVVDPADSICGLGNIKQGAGSFPVGSHLISSRRFYTHHGIYLGDGDVAHYSGFCILFKSGPIEVTNLERFANGKTVCMVQEQCEFSNDEIASRARSRIGESQYRLLSNNCEHFCSWCVSGESYSAQVNACLHFPRYLFSLIFALDSYFAA